MRDCTATASTPCDAALSTRCVCLATTRVGEPDAGNLHVRFDEGERRYPSLPTRLLFFVIRGEWRIRNRTHITPQRQLQTPREIGTSLPAVAAGEELAGGINSMRQRP